ncbi:YqjF family protein [Salinifilum ghardaiensis]
MITDPAHAAPEPVVEDAPKPTRPRLLRQQWREVTFLHWAVQPEQVAPLLPRGTRPDVVGGRTYAGLVLFRVVGNGFARGPALPWLGTFLETNVRLYSVDETGRRGVVFLSLDADCAPVVTAARVGFGLRYRWARMSFDNGDGSAGALRTYTARLRWPGARARSRVVVRPGEEPLDGRLEAFLTARWGLHVARFARTWHLPNAHERWPLRRAELLEIDDGLLASAGLGHVLGDSAEDRPRPDHVAFSDGVSAEFGRPQLARTPRHRS